ncbi:hypothetical protein pb186bvf_017896 [Paramecium bursaria]
MRNINNEWIPIIMRIELYEIIFKKQDENHNKHTRKQINSISK